MQWQTAMTTRNDAQGMPKEGKKKGPFCFFSAQISY